MKQKIKFAFSFISMCLLIIFSSCEAEKDTVVSENGKIIERKTISFTEFKRNDKAFQSLLKIQRGEQNISSKNLILDPTTNLVLDMDKIVEITKGDYKSYTILIEDESELEKVKNLVLSQKDGGGFDIYLTKYTLSEDERKRIDGGEVIDLRSRTELFAKSKSANDLSNPVRIDAAGNCYVIDRIWESDGNTYWTTVSVPCPEGMGGTSDDGGDSSSNGGVFWVPIPFPIPSGNDGTTDGGGSSGNGNPEIITYPVFDPNTAIKDLMKMTSNKANGVKTKIKERIEQLKSLLPNLLKENGSMFDSAQNKLPSYNQGSNFTAFANGSLPQFYIEVHMHQNFYLDTSVSPNVLKPTSPVYSPEDIGNLLLLYNTTNHNKNVTSILVSRLGTFALRITNISDANNAFTALTTDKIATLNFSKEYNRTIQDLYLAPPPMNEELIKQNLINLINLYQFNEHTLGLSLFEAVYDSEQNITNWVKL